MKPAPVTGGPHTPIKERQATTITAESAELAERYHEKLCVLCGFCGERVFKSY
jgi:hypothetical protein